MPGTAVLYLTHFVSGALLARFFDLEAACAHCGHDAILIFDGSRLCLPGRYISRIHEFTPAAVGARYFAPRLIGRPEGRLLLSHTDLALLHFHERRPEYDYYWLIEHDVRFSGDWCEFFQYFTGSDSDLLSTHVQRYQDNPTWCWWNSMGYRDRPVDRHQLVRAFLPLCRLSARACRVLAAEYGSGWTGFFEVRLPTILNLRGCILEDIGGEGQFVSSGNEHRFYIGEGSRTAREATFRWRPVMEEPGSLPGMLWHPVKDRDQPVGRSP